MKRFKTVEHRELHGLDGSLRFLVVALITLAAILYLLEPVYSEGPKGKYTFVRMWPKLKQPWYFSELTGITADSSGNVYIVDSETCLVQKYAHNGRFITKWKVAGNPQPGSSLILDIAVGTAGYVYVSTSHLYISDFAMGSISVDKYTSDGKKRKGWSVGYYYNRRSQDKASIATDRTGKVYVSDHFDWRIRKYTSKGKEIASWTNEPGAVGVDILGHVYATGVYENHVSKYSSSGTLITEWGKEGGKNGQFRLPWGITLDENGSVYVADSGNYRIQKFSSDGRFQAKWGRKGTGGGELQWPQAVAKGKGDAVYVASIDNVQKFSTDGRFIAKWSHTGEDDGLFSHPTGVALDGNSDVYVMDSGNHRVQKFTSSGRLLCKWGSKGTGNGHFRSPRGIAADGEGHVYVADLGNGRIQKFSSNGQFIAGWQCKGGTGLTQVSASEPESRGYLPEAEDSIQTGSAIKAAPVKEIGVAKKTRATKMPTATKDLASEREAGSTQEAMLCPTAIAVGHSGNVYAVCGGDILKFSPMGALLGQWTFQGHHDEEHLWYDTAEQIAVDAAENVYIINDWAFMNINCREMLCRYSTILKLTSDGELLNQWDLSGENYCLGGIAVDKDGKVYVADGPNHEVDVFEADGKPAGVMGGLGTGSGEMGRPSGVAVAQDGRIYVTEYSNHRVQVFK